VNKTSKEIEKDKQFLHKVAEKLKKKYKGIDPVIDSIIEKITPWYIYDDLLYFPTIVCLWGMTGIGKTSLIRDLVTAISYQDRYEEIDLSAALTDSWGSDLVDKASSYSGRSGVITNSVYRCIHNDDSKGIVLFDEVTKMDQGRIRDNNNLWLLLSDGKILDGAYKLKFCNDAIEWVTNTITDFDKNMMTRRLDFNHYWTAGSVPGKSGDKMDINEWMESMRREMEISDPRTRPVSPTTIRAIFRSYITPTTSYDQLLPFFDYFDCVMDPKVNRHPSDIRWIVKERIASGQMKPQDFFDLPYTIYPIPFIQYLNNRKMELIEQSKAISHGKDHSVLAKLLVFVVGNVPDLYADSKDISIDADTLHDRTSKYTVTDLRKVFLGENDKNNPIFAPEQLARFGSNHIIYPSLSSSAFREIIETWLEVFETDIKKQYDISLTLRTEKFIRHIYETSVIASQGARPLISKVRSKVGSLITSMVIEAMEKKQKIINVDSFESEWGM